MRGTKLKNPSVATTDPLEAGFLLVAHPKNSHVFLVHVILNTKNKDVVEDGETVKNTKRPFEVFAKHSKTLGN